MAISTARSIDRILKIPEPKCLVVEYGDDTVNMDLCLWIDDPANEINNVKDTDLMAVWDSFHANGIEIPFPQRDLNIKSAVPMEISPDSPRPFEKNSSTNEQKLEKFLKKVGT